MHLSMPLSQLATDALKSWQYGSADRHAVQNPAQGWLLLVNLICPFCTS